MTLVEVLENLDFFTEDDEKGSINSEPAVVVTSTEEAYSNLSEEDSADGDSTEFDFSNFGRKLLCAEAEAYWHGATI